MEAYEDIVIVGAGIAGLSTCLGLHRLGIRSLVLESSEELRVTGFALTTWFNAWKALEALGVAHSLRHIHYRLQGAVIGSVVPGKPTREMLLDESEEHEARCVQRRLLLEALANELPEGTIRFSSKVVCIEVSGRLKLVHLADGTVLKTKVLVGCDGVNSVVAKWLGFKKVASTGRSAIRGITRFQTSHGFGRKILQLFGNGVRSGFIPCDNNTVYWFLTYWPTKPGRGLSNIILFVFPPKMLMSLIVLAMFVDAETNPGELKQFVLNKLKDLPDNIKNVVESTDLDSIVSSQLRFRPPWEILWANITKNNICVAGDAFHPMTPDLGQGGCSGLEDGVVLARCLGEALIAKNPRDDAVDEEEEYMRIENGLRKYAKERKWRSIDLISTAYMVGFIQQSKGMMMNLFRDRFLSTFLARLVLKKTQFNCGKLIDDSR